MSLGDSFKENDNGTGGGDVREEDENNEAAAANGEGVKEHIKGAAGNVGDKEPGSLVPINESEKRREAHVGVADEAREQRDTEDESDVARIREPAAGAEDAGDGEGRESERAARSASLRQRLERVARTVQREETREADQGGMHGTARHVYRYCEQKRCEPRAPDDVDDGKSEEEVPIPAVFVVLRVSAGADDDEAR